MAPDPKFPIGTKYRTRGKAPRDCTVVDILRTFNAKDELVSVRYVSAHEFMGQIVIDRDVVKKEFGVVWSTFWPV
jgi:hypothetical protein